MSRGGSQRLKYLADGSVVVDEGQWGVARAMAASRHLLERRRSPIDEPVLGRVAEMELLSGGNQSWEK
jgi:hypothetical protein